MSFGRGDCKRGGFQEVVVSGLDCAKVVGAMILATWGIAPAAEQVDPELDAYLAYCASNYSQTHQMLGTEFRSPGYHTTVPDGTWVHPS